MSKKTKTTSKKTKKMKAEKEKVMKFKVFHSEVETLIVTRGPIIVSEETHPELKGKTKEEIIKYIEENAYEMKTDSEYYDSIAEELSDADIVRDKYIPESTEIIVEVLNDNDDENDEDEEEDFDDED